MTSHDVVGAVRRIFREKKTGHSGTLDPEACGVLPVGIGRATRAIEYLDHDEKSYRCEMKLGLTTDTGDIWGQPTGGQADRAARIRPDEVRSVLADLTGPQMQRPPMYSAVRVNGRRLYEYAREGRSVEAAPRKIQIFEIHPIRVLQEDRTVLFDVRCSRGTYVRTLCEEAGRRLGCGAVMTMLIRTSSGSFTLDNAVTFEELLREVEAAEHLTKEQILKERRDEPLKADMSPFLIPTDQMLPTFGAIHLNEAESRKFMNGGRISAKNAIVAEENREPEQSRFCDRYRIYGPNKTFIGTAARDPRRGTVTVDKVFFRW